MVKFSQIKYWLMTKSFGMIVNGVSLFNPEKAGNIAYNLFANPRDGKLNSYSEFLKNADKEIIIYNEHQIQTYEWKGNKETVLLIHGWESNSNRWQGMIQYLRKKKYNIISLDAPGQGMSSGKEFNAVLYAEFINEVCQKYKPTYLIGHSLGGMSMFYAQSKYQFPFVKKIIGLGSPNLFHRITRNYKNLLSLNNRTYRSYLNIFVKKFDIDTTYFNTENFIEKINQPLLIIHDKDDSIVPYNDAVQIVNKNPRVKFISTEKLGHSLFHNQVYKQAVSFLESE